MRKATVTRFDAETPDAPPGMVVQGQGDLRKKNQITLPKSVATALGLRLGDRILFVVKENEPGEAHLYRMPESFAGTAPHAFGGTESSTAYVQAERETWDE